MRENLWRDDFDSQLSDILNRAGDIHLFPAVCPICGDSSCHVYYHRFSETSDRGGSWVWCSHCRHFSHFSCVVPKWWKNTSDIDRAQLAAIPDYLEGKKEMIDNWLNKLLSDKLQQS